MKYYICSEFEGHWPVGVAAVMRADNLDAAIRKLEDELSTRGLTQDIKPGNVVCLDDYTGELAIVMCDGNY